MLSTVIPFIALWLFASSKTVLEARADPTILNPWANITVPASCQQLCIVFTAIKSCAAEKCVCNNAIGSEILTCADCIVNADSASASAGDIATGQAELDRYVEDCKSIGLAIKPLIISSNSTISTGTTTSSSVTATSTVPASSTSATTGGGSSSRDFRPLLNMLSLAATTALLGSFCI